MNRRQRLRRRLYLISAPMLVIVLLGSVKMISVVVVGESARSDFQSRDISALENDVSLLQILDVVEPGTTAFAAGDLDALAGRLPEAERHFTEALARTTEADSCPFRINLLLVQETLGDLAFQGGRRDESLRRYGDAMAVARDAPTDCLDGNNDPDEQRRTVRADTVPRLQRKLDVVSGPVLALPPPAAVPPVAPPAGQAPSAPTADPEAPPGRQLGPGDPNDLLRRLLDNANAVGGNQE